MVARISTSDPDLLRYLASIGLSLHSRITIIDVSPFDGNTSLKIDGEENSYTLGSRVTGKVFVESDSSRMSQPQKIT